MTQFDSEAWLERAREALAPRETDQARVLFALEQRLQLPTRALEHKHEPAHERSNSVELSSGTMKKLAPKTRGFLKLDAPSTLARWALRALVPVAAAGAISVIVATHSTLQRAPSGNASRQAPRPVAAAVTQASLPDALDLALAQAEAHDDGARATKPEPRPAGAAPAEKKPVRKKCRAANGSERPCASAKPAPPAPPTRSELASAPSTAAAPAASLSRELAALREAQSALRKGQPAQALEVLTRFEREMPGPGAMQEERNAAATMARCALSQSSSTRELYDGFIKRYPNSAYAARLRRICTAKQ